MTSPDLSDLIERVEAATSNDPELFWEAFAAVHGPKPERVHGGSKELNDYLAKSNPFFFMLKAGAFLDAAVTLVPKGAHCGMGYDSPPDGETTGKAWAWVRQKINGVWEEAPIDWRGHRPPSIGLAVLAAALRALQSRKDG